MTMMMECTKPLTTVKSRFEFKALPKMDHSQLKSEKSNEEAFSSASSHHNLLTEGDGVY